MMTYALKAAAPLALAASLCSLVATSALAASVVNGLALKNATPAAAEQVRWRGGRGWGYGLGGFAAGAIIGGAIVGAYGPYPYYGYGYPAYYYPAPGYAGPGYPGPGYAGPGYPAYAAPSPPPGGDAMGYCMQRFRSFDPRSGTYLGNDGYRHPCP